MALDPLPQPVFRLASVVFPATIEERDASFDGAVDDLDRCLLIFGCAKMVTA